MSPSCLGIKDIIGATGFTLINSRLVRISAAACGRTQHDSRRTSISPTMSSWAATIPNA